MSKSMKLFWSAVLASFSAGQALAQGIRIEPASVLSVVTSDWNDDGLMDRAVLYDDGAEDAALAIYFSSSEGDWRMVGFDPDNAWSGGWGQIPALSLNNDGGLVITSMNIGMGRNRWQLDLTLAYAGGKFAVKTYKYADYDSLDPENYGTCEVDYLAGVAQVSRGGSPLMPSSIPRQTIQLGDWTYQDVPEVCQ